MNDSAHSFKKIYSTATRLTRAEIQFIQKLQRKKHRIDSGLIFIEGLRLCMEAIKSDWKIQQFIFAENLLVTDELEPTLTAIRDQKIPVCTISSRDFNKISNTVNAQGIGAVLHLKPPEDAASLLQHPASSRTIVAIETLADPGNLGTIIRTAEWLGIDGIVLGENSVAWHNDKVVRASMGAVFHFPIFQSTDFTTFLTAAANSDFTIYAGDQNGQTPLAQIKKSTNSILLFGDEAHGLSESVKKMIAVRICIPGSGKVESLNVASAAAIIMARFSELQDR